MRWPVAFSSDVPSIHVQKKYSHIFWLINVWFTNFHDIEPVRHKYIMKNHHDAMYPFASLMVPSPASPAFHNGSPLGLLAPGPLAKSLWNSLQERERSRARPWPRRCWPTRRKKKQEKQPEHYWPKEWKEVGLGWISPPRHSLSLSLSRCVPSLWFLHVGLFLHAVTGPCNRFVRWFHLCPLRWYTIWRSFTLRRLSISTINSQPQGHHVANEAAGRDSTGFPREGSQVAGESTTPTCSMSRTLMKQKLTKGNDEGGRISQRNPKWKVRSFQNPNGPLLSPIWS